MNAKKIVSTLTVFAMLTSLPVTVLARPVTTHQTVAKLDLSNYSSGEIVTPEQLSSLGFNISSKNEGGMLPQITVQEQNYDMDNGATRITEKALCFEITNKTPFLLSAPLSVSDAANALEAEYSYKVEDGCTDNTSEEKAKRVDFSNFGSVHAENKSIISPVLHKEKTNSSYMLLDTHTSIGPGWVFCYNNWNKVTYSLDYSNSTLSYKDIWSWGTVMNLENAPLNISGKPNEITWATGNVSDLPDGVSVKLYISGFSVMTEEQNAPGDTVSSNETTFFDGAGANGAAVNPASMMNNVFKITGEWGQTTAQNSTELPASADRIGFQFCGLNVPDGPAKLILARYAITDGNFKKLTDVSVNDVTITDGKAVSNTPLDLTKETVDGTLVQAYLWDAFSTITPLSAYGFAEIGKTGEKIYSLSFEDADHEDVSGKAGYLGGVDNSKSTVTIVSDDEARYGSKAIKVDCLAKSELSENISRNGFRFVTSEGGGWTNLSKEAAAGIGKDNKYKISFYAKASDADAVIKGSLGAESDDATYRWKAYDLFKNVTVKPGDWQYFVIYTDLPDCTLFDKKWSEYANECPYDVLNFDVETDVHQSVYFDNVLIEKLDTASTAE